MVMALDLATRTGVAYGRADDRAPKAMTWRLPKSFDEHEFGERYTALRRHLIETCPAMGVDVLGYEAPLMAGGVMTPQTAQFLIGLTAIAEQVCHELGIECVQKAPSSARKHFCGNGRAKKPEVAIACQRLGWHYENHDEVDAIALWSLIVAEVWPAGASNSTPLYAGAR